MARHHAIGAHVSWANTEDRAARSAKGQAGLRAKFERQVDPDGTLTDAERAFRADQLHKAHMLRLANASAKARAKKTA